VGNISARCNFALKPGPRQGAQMPKKVTMSHSKTAYSKTYGQDTVVIGVWG